MAYPYNLSEILIYMGYNPETDFLVLDELDGGSPPNNPKIIQWNAGSPMPSEDDINAWLTGPGPLTIAKSKAKILVDTTAEIARLRYITAGSGQAQAYQQKGEDAESFISAGYPTGSPIDLSDYPFIQAEVEATGKTPQQAADDIVSAKQLTIEKLSSIEQKRIGGKTDIDSASTEEEVDTIKNTTITELNAI